MKVSRTITAAAFALASLGAVEAEGLTRLHQLGPIFAIFGASDRDK